MSPMSLNALLCAPARRLKASSPVSMSNWELSLSSRVRATSLNPISLCADAACAEATVYRDNFPPMSVKSRVVQRPQVKDIQLLGPGAPDNATKQQQQASLAVPPPPILPANVQSRLPLTSSTGVQPASGAGGGINNAFNQIQDPAILSVST